jgi:predicted CXXCH cytochrome family protein
MPLQLLPPNVADDWSGSYSYTRTNDGCLSCHPELELLDGLRGGFATLNTINFHGLHVRLGQCLCIECHEPHGTVHPFMLRPRLMTGEALILRQAMDGANCTVRCHHIDHAAWAYRNKVL